MVRHAPDQSEEPLNKRGRQEMEEEEEEVDSESEAEAEVDDLMSEEDVEEEDDDDEVPSDAEDEIPAVDEEAMATIYNKVVENAISIVPNRAPSTASTRSTGSVLRYDGINTLMSSFEEMWGAKDQSIYKKMQENLWPIVFQAVGILRGTGRLNHTNLLDENVVSPEFEKEFEDAMEIMMKAKRNRTDPQTWQETQDRIAYETRRVKVLQVWAQKYHKQKQTRPGWHHAFGVLLPVQTSYNMIEYLAYAMTTTGFSFEDNMVDNTVWHPEIDELNPEGRRLMESVLVMDPSFRCEFVQTIRGIRKEMDSHLTDEEEKIVVALFDEMNSIFNWNFEHFIIAEAEIVKQHRIAARFCKFHRRRFRHLTREANEAQKQLQKMLAER